MMAKRGAREQRFASWLGDRSQSEASHTHGTDPLIGALDELYGEEPTRAATDRAISRVRAALAAEGLTYGQIPESPIGPIHVALSGEGLVAVEFGVNRATFLAHMIREHGVEPIEDQARSGEVLAQIKDYLAGERTSFDLTVDLRGRTDFQRLVLRAASGVPRGGLATYGEIAREIGRPRAARAVGQALARNPVPIVIPCHRVVAADGSLTGYSGGRGIETKQALLRLEGALAG